MLLKNHGRHIEKLTSSVLFSMISLSDIQYPCGVCCEDCEGNPIDHDKQSIACDKCQMWHHYSCIGLTGLEPFLIKWKSTWKCSKCNKQQRKRNR